MSKTMQKFRMLFVVVLVLHLFIVPYQSASANVTIAEVELDILAPSWISPIDYLALGDSLAVGINPNNEFGGDGYTDYLAAMLLETDNLKTFNKGFTFPGYKTENILADLNNNMEKGIKLHDAIREAELITISVGANDVLAHIDATTMTLDPIAIASAIQKVGVNYQGILSSIYAINPDVQVYVMGYYNPFPHLAKELQPQLDSMLNGLNHSIGTTANNLHAEFVATKDVIAENPLVYLPNPQNIHLSEVGYEKVAKQFWNEMENEYPWVPETNLLADVINVNSVSLNWAPATDDVGVASYEVYNGEEKIATVNGTIYSYIVEDLAENTEYVFSVIAIDEAGNRSVYHPEVQVTIGEKPAIFTDISGHWAKAFIEEAAGVGIIQGYPDGTFKPNQQLTRMQAASLLVRALKLEASEVAPFSDIAGYADVTQAEIAAAYQHGIVKGYYGGTFKPSQNVTRGQMALMIQRAYTAKTGVAYIAKETAPYPDIKGYDTETINAISMLYELEIATGSDGKFNPGQGTTRAHAAKILHNFFNLTTQGK